MVLTAWDYGQSSEWATAGLTDKTVLLAALTHVEAGGTYLIAGDYFTAMNNGVIEVTNNGLTPWDTTLENVVGRPIGDLSLDDAVTLLK